MSFFIEGLGFRVVGFRVLEFRALLMEGFCAAAGSWAGWLGLASRNI